MGNKRILTDSGRWISIAVIDGILADDKLMKDFTLLLSKGAPELHRDKTALLEALLALFHVDCRLEQNRR